MRKSIKDVLMERDGMSSEEAEEAVEWAREEFHNRLENGDDPSDLCEELFSLEPDYLDDLLY